MAKKNAVGSKASPRTSKACQACAKRRSRVRTNQRPCHRCKKIKIECVREEPVRLSKSQLRQEKARLQARHNAACVIFNALASGKRSDKIIGLLRQNEPIQQIADQLVAKYDYEVDGSSSGSNSTNQHEGATASTQSQSSPAQSSIAWSPGKPTFASPFELEPEQVPLYHSLDHILDMVPIEFRSEPQQTLETVSNSSDSSFLSEQQHSVSTPATGLSLLNRHSASPSTITEQFENEDCFAKDAFASMKVPPCLSPCDSNTITLITLPSNLILDLTDAFFTWHAAPFPAIQRPHFTSDFLSQQTKHCSPALIRIISCLGCRALGGYDTSHSTYASLGNRLFEESRMLLAGAPSCVPDVHACGLLALHQLGIGQYGDAAKLAEEGVKRMASIMGSETSQGAQPSEPSENTDALCSAVALARFIRLMLGYLTEHHLFMASPLVLERSREADNDLDALLSLRGPLPTGPSCRDVPSSPLLIYSLIDIVYRYLATIQSSKVDAAHAANYHGDTYRKCLLWCDIALGNGSKQSELCPFTQMLYYFCLLVLWRPSCQPPLVPDSANVTVCVESAGAILSLAGSSHVRDHRASNQFFLAHLFVLAASLPGVPAGAHWERSTVATI